MVSGFLEPALLLDETRTGPKWRYPRPAELRNGSELIEVPQLFPAKAFQLGPCALPGFHPQPGLFDLLGGPIRERIRGVGHKSEI